MTVRSGKVEIGFWDAIEILVILGCALLPIVLPAFLIPQALGLASCHLAQFAFVNTENDVRGYVSTVVLVLDVVGGLLLSACWGGYDFCFGYETFSGRWISDVPKALLLSGALLVTFARLFGTLNDGTTIAHRQHALHQQRQMHTLLDVNKQYQHTYGAMQTVYRGAPYVGYGGA